MGHLNAQDIIAVNWPERSFSIHRLVGARILDQLDDAGLDAKWQATFDMAVELLFDKFPRQEMGLWLEQGHETCRLYLPHIQSLARHYRNLPGLLSRNKLYELLHSSTWYEFEIPFSGPSMPCAPCIPPPPPTSARTQADQTSLGYPGSCSNRVGTEICHSIPTSRSRCSREWASPKASRLL